MGDRSNDTGKLEGMTVKALKTIASELGIPGRSKMSRAELVRHIAIHGNEQLRSSDLRPRSKNSSFPEGNGSSRSTSPDSSSMANEASPDGPYSNDTTIMVEPTAPPYLDRGRPIPNTYGDDRIGFMIQGPRSGYVYWELSGPLTERFRLAYGKDLFHSTRWVLRIHAIPLKQFQHISIDVQTFHTYIQLDPGCRYQVSLGFNDTDGSFVPVLDSKAEDTPRETVSTVVDERRMIETGTLLTMVGGVNSIKELGSSSLVGVRFKQAYELHVGEGEVR